MIKLDRICEHTFFSLLNENSVVLDFGCNEGKFAHTVIERYGCQVFSAEPVPDCVERIARHPRLTLRQVAISGTSGSLDIHVYPDRCASGFNRSPGEQAIRTIRAEAMTLAEFRRRSGIGRIALLKIDIEGAELDMFAAAADEEFSDIDQITVEFHDFLYPEMRPAVKAVKRRMRSLGFHMLPFSLDNTDVLFVNRRAAVNWHNRLWAGTVVKYGRGLERRLRQMIGRPAPADC
ncbi:FkbM family methyltransferase [Azospirillum sp. B2RO_4]|uniref:FkbM family methyltransferase n=1 Tax=Azospirillum sp. B2RO_4 TaxID=3027796 RepID=UPI003DA851FD